MSNTKARALTLAVFIAVWILTVLLPRACQAQGKVKSQLTVKQGVTCEYIALQIISPLPSTAPLKDVAKIMHVDKKMLQSVREFVYVNQCHADRNVVDVRVVSSDGVKTDYSYCTFKSLAFTGRKETWCKWSYK